MALYGQSNLASQPSSEQLQQQQPGSPQIQTPQPAIQPQQLQQPQRSATMPLPSSNKNPFFQTGGNPAVASAGAPDLLAQQQQQQQKNHASRESMAFSDMNWANGRHSPDAFASLSSRHM